MTEPTKEKDESAPPGRTVRRPLTPPPRSQPRPTYVPQRPQPRDWRAPADWTGRPTLRRKLLAIAVDIPLVAVVAWVSNKSWGWMVFVGVAYPLLAWLGMTYQGWLGKRFGMDKPPPPLTWRDPPERH